MNEKERAALTALRDVMAEHDIAFEAGYVGGVCKLTIRENPVVGNNGEVFRINTDIITKLLEQETE